MKIGILQFDSVATAYRQRHGDYSDMLIQLFQRCDSQIQFSVYDIRQEQQPRHWQDCDAYITTGSKASTYDENSINKTAATLLHQIADADRKLVGICYGHQLLAASFGGHCAKSTKGWGIGLMHNCIVQQQDWMQPPQQQVKLLVSHQDQVERLPSKALHLARNPHCEYFMFQLGDNILGLQGHPEFSKAYLQAHLDANSYEASPACLQQARQSLTDEADDQLVAQWLLQFMQN